MLETLVIVDYQNIHLTAHDLWAPAGTAKHETLIHPCHFATQIVQTRNRLLGQRAVAGKPRHAGDAQLAAVAVYRGRPSNEHDPAGYRRSLAQQSEWTRDRRVEVNLRSLRYYWSPVEGRHVPREKGVDVQIALRLVQEAEACHYPVVILATHDTDLEAALEVARGKPGVHIETARWQGAKMLRPTDWLTTLDSSAFVRSRDRKDYT